MRIEKGLAELFRCLLLALLLLAFATPVEACFPWCIFGSPQPDSPPSNSSETVELITREPPRFALDEAEVRRAFDLAYGRQKFASESSRQQSYEAWTATIPDPVEESGVRMIDYMPDPDHMITAELDLASGTMEFVITSTDTDFARQHGSELGLERDSGAGLFARALVALGGTAAVTSIHAQWSASSDNYDTFDRLVRNGDDPLAAANETFTGKTVQRFYGFVARSILQDADGDYEIIFASPASVSLANGGAARGPQRRPPANHQESGGPHDEIENLLR
jgi:hypothetical protein